MMRVMRMGGQATAPGHPPTGRALVGVLAAVVFAAAAVASCVLPSSPPNPTSLVTFEYIGDNVCNGLADPFTIVNGSPWPVRIDYIQPLLTYGPPVTFSIDTEVLPANGGRAHITSSDPSRQAQVWYTFLGGPTTSSSFRPVGTAVEGFDGGSPQLLDAPPTNYSGILPGKFCSVGSAIAG